MIKLIELYYNHILIKNIDYYEKLLTMGGLSKKTIDFTRKVIHSVRKNNNMASPNQYNYLQNLKNGHLK